MGNGMVGREGRGRQFISVILGNMGSKWEAAHGECNLSVSYWSHVLLPCTPPHLRSQQNCEYGTSLDFRARKGMCLLSSENLWQPTGAWPIC